MTAHQNRTVSEKPLKKNMPMEQKPKPDHQPTVSELPPDQTDVNFI